MIVVAQAQEAAHEPGEEVPQPLGRGGVPDMDITAHAWPGWTDLFSLVREMQQMLSTRAIPTSEAVLLQVRVRTSASKRSIPRFVITKKSPTRAFSWLKAATTLLHLIIYY